MDDDTLFLSRRLGYGLKPDEIIKGPFRDWAVNQLKNPAPLDFYGPDGNSIRATFPADAEPLKNFAEACREYEKYQFPNSDKNQIKSNQIKFNLIKSNLI